jgi:MarR family transcriptional regulator, organic hydroperoxide resistance regulator
MTMATRLSKAAPIAKKRKAEAGKMSSDSIGRLLRGAHRTFNRALQLRIAGEDVTIRMWHYLRELWEEDGIDQRELSRRTGALETSVVSSIALLEKKGLVRREQDPQDRRRNIVFLTKRGRALEYLLGPIARDTNEIAMEGISKSDEEVLRRALIKITSNLERHAEP